jgi:hypothetical protein
MGKLYNVTIQNIITDRVYSITSFGTSPQSIHKHVLYKVVSRNEKILYISLDDTQVFDNDTGFFTE